MDNGATWHQHSSWVQPLARVQSLSCHDISWFSTAKTWISAGEHRGSGLFLFGSLSILGDCFALSRGGFFYRLSTLSADRYYAKTMFGCLNEFFKKCQNFDDNGMPLQMIWKRKGKSWIFKVMHAGTIQNVENSKRQNQFTRSKYCAS